jgi:hypothetical protein
VKFSLVREKWWGFFMGWVLKGSRQKLVVCRYEEEPARGVSLVVKQQFHRGETYSGGILRESSLYIILSAFFLFI